ncbi:DUF3298 domain-containing protein, partial [Salmonella enterica subsp. enterica serovar Derby]|nr:DUF3298 and DUF4163 domain-containing protein [Salmonella enterica]ECA3425645.1 DUF3298 domain-containing protein [Salmonella enterica subsp. enterica serovar Derby]ECJ8800566.1 DUF3298 and DUF4163 domain-containing protein [Salmonella enterica subsp. enterica serovar Derby]ECU6061067.1 DUF3298 domain-containing protein [Salmonella enterica subsp. enterica serovar Derby]EDG7380424.1 DUF3298 domain-containing protein [Salmonella enterica subsp. enterica serovar Derby]
INDAIEKLKYYKPDDIFVIPLLIDDSQVPSYISNKIQFIDFKRNDGWEIFDRSLRLAASQQNLEIVQGIQFGLFTFKTNILKEEYKQIPGHDIEISYPVINNSKNSKSSDTLSKYFEGRAVRILFNNRTSPWPLEFDWNKEYKSTYTDSYYESYNIAFCNDSVISILHTINWYGAGAAHPNTAFEVSNFVITDNDYSYKFSIYDLFNNEDSQEAISKIKRKLIEDAPRVYWERTGEKAEQSDMDWFTTGVENSDLSNFTLNQSGFTFHFPPYELHCYALGSWEFFISFFEVIDHLKKDSIYQLIKGE